MTRHFLLRLCLALAMVASHGAHAAAYQDERIASPTPGLRLNLIHAQRSTPADQPSPVLYVHGSTFASHLAIAWPLNGQTWMDHLGTAGFDVWGLDFLGYGKSDRYPEGAANDAASIPGRTAQASEQIAAAVRHILKTTGARRINVIAHSWGTQPAARFAGDHPELVERLVLFGAPFERKGNAGSEPAPAATVLVSLADQWNGFARGLPQGQQRLIAEADFGRWGAAYLDTDAASRSRTPAAVRVPFGPEADIAASWRGRLTYDPARVSAPVMLVRGEFDTVCDDADAAWFEQHFVNAKVRSNVKLKGGTHRMHLESSHALLWDSVRDFLRP